MARPRLEERQRSVAADGRRVAAKRPRPNQSKEPLLVVAISNSSSSSSSNKLDSKGDGWGGMGPQVDSERSGGAEEKREW